jgi:hypothetical protein
VHRGDANPSILLALMLHLGDITPNYTYFPLAIDSFSTSKDAVETRNSAKLWSWLTRIHGKFGPTVLAELGVSGVEAIGDLSVKKYISYVSLLQLVVIDMSSGTCIY